MKQCPACRTELSLDKDAIFVTCPECNFLLYIDKNGIEKVDEKKIRGINWKMNSLLKWVCSSILGHQWSNEGYVLSDDEQCCGKLRVCKRCFDSVGAHVREHHAFIEDYVQDDSCEKRRVCTKCGKIVILKNLEHQFNLPDYYFIEGTCEQERKCSHCGLVEKLGTNHWFCDPDWIVPDITKCKSTRACRKCGQLEEAITHSGEWIVLERKSMRHDGNEIMFHEKRICDVCSYEETRERYWESPIL